MGADSTGAPSGPRDRRILLSHRAGFINLLGVKILRFLLCGAAALSLATLAVADSPATNTAAAPTQSPAPQKPQPNTPAPKQANAKAAPKAQSPNTEMAKKGKAKEKPVTASATPANPAATAAATPAPAAPAMAAAKQTQTVLDHFLQDLDDALKLTAEQKKQIQSYYLADAAPLHSILDDPSSSPLQQAQQAADLRNRRNARVESVLADVQQQHDFYTVEANYRVALLEAAADGTLGGAPVQGGAGGGAVAPTPTPAAPAAHGPAQ